MKKILILLGGILGIIGCLFVLVQGPILERGKNFSFSSSARVLGGGTVFFNVSMKSPNVSMEKLIYRLGSREVFVKAVHFSVPVLELLKKKAEIASAHLDIYQPYRDILRFPLETLALAGIDTLEGTLACTGRKVQSTFSSWYCTLERQDEKPVFITLGCLTDMQTPFSQMICPDMRISLPIGKTVATYARYAKGSEVPFPLPDKMVLELRLTLPEQPLITLFEQGMTDVQVQVLP